MYEFPELEAYPCAPNFLDEAFDGLGSEELFGRIPRETLGELERQYELSDGQAAAIAYLSTIKAGEMLDRFEDKVVILERHANGE